MPFWLNNGGIVLDATGAVLCNNCPCAGCPYCETDTPEEVLVEFAGVVDGGGCFDCDYWNTNSFSLLRVSDCMWTTTVDGPACDGGPYEITYELFEDHLELTVVGPAGIVLFEKVVATPLDCDNITDILNISTPSLFACGWTFAVATILPA